MKKGPVGPFFLIFLKIGQKNQFFRKIMKFRFSSKIDLSVQFSRDRSMMDAKSSFQASRGQITNRNCMKVVNCDKMTRRKVEKKFNFDFAARGRARAMARAHGYHSIRNFISDISSIYIMFIRRIVLALYVVFTT